MKNWQRDYTRIENILLQLDASFPGKLSLQELAQHVGLSPFHFGRLFKRWAGISPQRFMHYMTKEYARSRLIEARDVLDVAFSAGLSGPGRLHDLMVTFEALSPGELKNRGQGVTITYGFAPSPFGECLVAETHRGICALRFVAPESRAQLVAELKSQYRSARFAQNQKRACHIATQLFRRSGKRHRVRLHVPGTNFQVKVWEALLRIPEAHLVTYGNLAKRIGMPSSSRAVGQAVASNPVAYLIPCHRVINSLGNIGLYRWGEGRKRALIGWEAAHAATSTFL